MKARGFEDLTFLNLTLTLCGMKKRRCLWLFFCLIRIASKTYIISLQFLQVSLSNFFSEGDSWGKFSIMRVLLFTSSAPQDILVRFLYCLQRVRLFVSSKMNSFFSVKEGSNASSANKHLIWIIHLHWVKLSGKMFDQICTCDIHYMMTRIRYLLLFTCKRNVFGSIWKVSKYQRDPSSANWFSNTTLSWIW